jgi:hypothetical protein
MRVLAILTLAACATRGQPYRFASPMIGGADVPPAALPGESAAPHHTGEAAAARHDPAAGIVVAPPPIASAAAADAIPHAGLVYSQLSAPNLVPADAPLPAIHAPTDLRALVGRRTKADPFALALGWEAALGHSIPTPPEVSEREHRADPARSSIAGRAITRAAREADDAARAGLAGEQLLAWARDAHVLHELDTPPEPGDLIVFDEIESAADADLIAVVVARDERNVTEMIYASGGVIRRGFVDANRPALRRDHEGKIVNTSMRSGRRWPPKGTHYLAGELLAHVIRP